MNTLGLLLPLALANPPVAPVPPPGLGMAAPAVPVMAPRGGCPPVGPPAPVLAVRVLAPAGVTVGFRPGLPDAPRGAAPAAANLRPGYRHLLELANLPGHPGRSLYPVVDVLGSLVPRANLNVLEFPAPLLFTQGDIDRAVAGSLVTKVVYLEDPTKAAPVASTPDSPLEFTELAVADALATARDTGRLVAVVRLGDRAPDREELARAYIPGAAALPGEALAPAAVPPGGPCQSVPLYDPVLGPKPTPEECITDGGDKGKQAGVGPGGRVGGLDPTDVVVKYRVGTRERVATSNEVCVCSPRFITRRVEQAAGGFDVRVALNQAIALQGRGTANQNVAPASVSTQVRPAAVVSRAGPQLVFVSQGVAEMVQLVRPQVRARLRGPAETRGVQTPEEITSGPDALVVTKTVDPAGPVTPGTVVTFTLTYRNATPYPATDLLISDSLSGRLEYVPGSNQADRPGSTTTQPNEAGSVIVQFEIPGPVPPGASGVVKFRARVR